MNVTATRQRVYVAAQVSLQAQFLLETIKKLSKARGYCWAEPPALAKLIKRSLRSVQVYLKELREAGLISEEFVDGERRTRATNAPAQNPALSAESCASPAQNPAPNSAGSCATSAALPYSDELTNEKRRDFELTPEGLAQQFVFVQLGRKESVVEIAQHLGEAIRLGKRPEDLRAAIAADRNRSERFWMFESREIRVSGGPRHGVVNGSGGLGSRVNAGQASIDAVRAKTMRAAGIAGPAEMPRGG